MQLYKPTNTNYRRNGDYMVTPVKATFHGIVNGTWCVDITIAQTEPEIVEAFQEEAIIKFDLPRLPGQLYVVKNPQKDGFDTVSAQAFPIGLLDAQNELVMRDCRPTNMLGQEALEHMLAGCNAGEKYTVSSDINRPATAYYIRKNFIEALCGDDENAFIHRWGGEVSYDNYHISVNFSMGQESPATLMASKNISGFTVQEDDSDFVDTIIPVGYNGWTSANEISRSTIGRVRHRRFVEYGHIRHKDDQQDGDTEDEGVIICQTDEEMESELAKAAQADFAAGNYQPKYTYSIDYIDLRNSGEYAQFSDLVSLWLGDTVTVENLDSHIAAKQKVIELTYNILTDEIESIVLGQRAESFFDTTSQMVADVSQVIGKDAQGRTTLIGEQLRGSVDMMKACLRAQRNTADRLDCRAVLFEDIQKKLDDGLANPMFGALAIGTQGLEITKRRLEDDSDWDWRYGTAIDYQSIYANQIMTGLLCSQRLSENFDTLYGGVYTAEEIAALKVKRQELDALIASGAPLEEIEEKRKECSNFWIDMNSGAFVLGEGLFKGTITTKHDAKIGRYIYLDYDHEGEAESALLVGDPATEEWAEIIKRPMIHVKSKADGTDYFMALRSGGESDYKGFELDDNYLRIVDWGSKNGFMVNDDGVWLCGDDVFVSDEVGGAGTKGITYSGPVSSITTNHGLVTGASYTPPAKDEEGEDG